MRTKHFKRKRRKSSLSFISLGKLTIYAQVALAVKQQHPKKLEAAVTAVLEIESYLNPNARTAGCIAQAEADPGTQSLVAAVQMKQDAMMDMLKMMGRLEKLEKKYSTPSYGDRKPTEGVSGGRKKDSSTTRDWQTSPSNKVICRRCKQEGHYARGCANPTAKQQGN